MSSVETGTCLIRVTGGFELLSVAASLPGKMLWVWQELKLTLKINNFELN